MGLLDRLFKKKEVRKQPEDYYDISITDDYVMVEHPKRDIEKINWDEIQEISIVTTDEGPFLPDVWLMLMGNDKGCSMPQGAPKYDEVYDIVSKYDGFDFEEVIKAATSTDNAKFELWKKNKN
ncbi:hypothetical protein [Snuella lapsa]|uniref:Uncharacterized protein n=1 Tax=Snuella lapsa TaxID=870481 RepID=A0ABP6YEG3_9FLAO